MGQAEIQAALTKLLAEGYVQAQGMVMTPPQDRSWKGNDSKEMHIRKFKVACGLQVVTFSQFDDSTQDFYDVRVGQVVRVDISSCKSEKGSIEIGGVLTVLAG